MEPSVKRVVERVTSRQPAVVKHERGLGPHAHEKKQTD
jgi:hypothetical protein